MNGKCAGSCKSWREQSRTGFHAIWSQMLGVPKLQLAPTLFLLLGLGASPGLISLQVTWVCSEPCCWACCALYTHWCEHKPYRITPCRSAAGNRRVFPVDSSQACLGKLPLEPQQLVFRHVLPNSLWSLITVSSSCKLWILCMQSSYFGLTQCAAVVVRCKWSMWKANTKVASHTVD